MKYTLDRPRRNRYSIEAIVNELRRVATHFKHRRFTRHEFDQVATVCKGSVVLSRFGTWQAALKATDLTLAEYRKPRLLISDAELFDELGRIWRRLGHRPSKDEWDASDARYSYTTYKTRFKGWINACVAFIEHASGLANEPSTSEKFPDTNREKLPETPTRIPTERVRQIPLKLRLKILQRDNFKCVLCGRSPALNPGTALQLDHIQPFSKGGKTALDNLRTLCQECNLGKGIEV